MDNDNVVVEEVRPAEVTKPKALRLFAGKFIVDFVESLGALLVGVALFVPASMADLQKLALLLFTPVLAAAISAGRRGWPILREWLNPTEAN